MRAPPLVSSVLVALASAPAAAYEGEVDRPQPDAGVHVPVLTRAPELLEFVQAPYPPEAEAEGLAGSVKLRVTIGADGSVSEAEVVEPAGHGFDEAALEAVRRFRFSPAEVDGVPAPVQIEYVYHFVLEARPAEPAADAGVAPAPRTATLTGEIVSRGSRRRVPAATVRCGDDADAPEALSDERGRFTLEVAAGTCAVKVVANGFHLFETTEELAPGTRLEVAYHLIPRAIGYETVVRGQREKKEVVRRTLERQELQRVPGTFGDPVRVVENLPGVARVPYVGGALIVRGASPDQTGTLFDGVEIPLLYHFLGGPSVVNAEFLDRVDFYPGGFGARYGRAVGGIVDVGTRKGASDTWHGSVDVDFLDAGLFVEAPLSPGISAAVAARRSYIDGILPFVLPQDPAGGTLLILPRYWDYQARVDFGPRRTDAEAAASDGVHTGYVMAFGSDDVLRVVATGGGRNRDLTISTRTTFHRVKGDWTYRRGGFTSTFTPYVGYDLGAFSFGDSSGGADIYNVGGREDATLELSPNLTARAGVDVMFEHLRGEADLEAIGGLNYVPFPGDQPKAESFHYEVVVNSFDAAVFGEVDVKAGPVTLTPGLRASRARINAQNRWTLEPRLWVRFEPTEAFALKGSAGLYTQPPEATNMEPPPLGTPALLHERAFQASVGAEYRFTDAIGVDVTGYYNRRYDLVVSPGPDVVNPDGSITLNRFANLGLGRAYGLEVLLRHDVTREFFGWIAYTLNRSEARRAGPNPYVLTGFDQTHILTAVGSYRLPYGFEVGARFRYVTGLPRTPIPPGPDLLNLDTNDYNPRIGVPLSAREQPFHQLDVRVDKAFLFRSWTLGVYLDVQNVYNAQNVEARLTDYRYREEVAVPGLPFLPVLGVKGSF